MAKLVTNISVFIAGCFLVIHTMVPHQHHADDNQIVSSTEQALATDLFDLIQQAFHFDLGENHLEEYEPVIYKLVSMDIYCSELTEVIFVPWEPLVKHPSFIASHQLTLSDLLRSSLPFRGPPAIS